MKRLILFLLLGIFLISSLNFVSAGFIANTTTYWIHNDIDTQFTKYQQFVRNCFAILPRQALHAKSLAFDHPVTRKRLSFDSELPEDMRKVADKWRNYISGRDSPL